MIDGHIHFAKSMKTERLNAIIEEYQLERIALLCIPKGGNAPVETDALEFQKQCKVPVYIFGGISREIFAMDKKELSGALVEEVKRLHKMGCIGIKMLEGKPDVRKAYPIPDFDTEPWEAYWELLEQEQTPVYMHVNDPEEFWDPDKVSEYAKKVGWFYDCSFINNEEQYTQVLHVLEKHPKLRILFPHFFFCSKQLKRLGHLLDCYPNVRIDVTPGIELYENLSQRHKEAVNFFQTYQDRICYGTDIGARSVIHAEDIPLSIEETRGRIQLITRFLEESGTYLLEPDGYYVKDGGTRVMHGLGLEQRVLEKIYRDNFMEFIYPNE
ncbi:MAG: amidohydrolase family protein [Lachnospiraceae bacterium]